VCTCEFLLRRESFDVILINTSFYDGGFTDVVPPESLAELSPRHLVAIRKGGGEGLPQGTHGPVELLGYEQRLLCLRAVDKIELSLGRVKPAAGLQWVHDLSEHRWVCRQEV
jgi:hypothetical protein